MSVFWQDLPKFEGQSRSQQMEQLKIWSAEMATKAPADTKPAKPNCDMPDVENNVVGTDGSVGCSNQLCQHQQHKILLLEEQLKTLQQDNTYMEELLHMRDSTVYKYVDLYGQASRKCQTLDEKVGLMESTIKDKDKAIQKWQATIDVMLQADQHLAMLQKQQRQLTTSTVALHKKLKKTKMVTAHTLQYTTTEPPPEVRDEMALAREREKLRESTYIAKLAGIVDKVAKKYSPEMTRYVSTHLTNDLVPQQLDVAVHPDYLPAAVPEELLGIWTFLEEPTEAEVQLYEAFLVGPPPGPIYSPNMPKPCVNWARLNTNMHRSLPPPRMFPVQGCSPNPAFYITTEGVSHPFGSLYGFHTSMGVVALPDVPVHGYLCDQDTGMWIIAAEGAYPDLLPYTMQEHDKPRHASLHVRDGGSQGRGEDLKNSHVRPLASIPARRS